MIFVDASAFVAIIAGESDADDLANRMERSEIRFCSALSIYETVAGLCHSHGYAPASAKTEVTHFRKVGGLTYVQMSEREAELALAAYQRYGKGRHPAGLNMGDCFAYACAKANNAKLLYKGDDFTKTDIERA